MKKITLSLATVFILLSSFTANAELNMGGKTVFTGTLIKILEPGPATQIQAIITNITDASASKPYLIHLGPGVYDLVATNIIMKEWVSIQGSGQESTKIAGAVSTGNFSTVVGKNYTSLTDITIENTGGGSVSVGITNSNASPRIERVTVIASGGSGSNYGVSNLSSSSPIMTNVTVSGVGGTGTNGVRNTSSSSPIMTNVTVIASGGSNANYGVNNFDSSSPIMSNVTVSASGGAGNFGVYNRLSSSPTMTNVTATGSGGVDTVGVKNDNSSPTMMNVTATGSGGSGNNFGILNVSSAAPYIVDSIMEGSTYGLFITSDASGTRVVNSKIIGVVANNAAGTQCRGNYKADLADVNC